MSSDPHTKGPHDIGGEAAGPIDTTDHGMLFWEKQANALRSTLSRSGLVTVDELRRAAESLGDEYRKLAYFEVTTSALRTVLLEKGYFSQAELDAKMAEIRRRFEVPDSTTSRLPGGDEPTSRLPGGDKLESPIKKKAKK